MAIAQAPGGLRELGDEGASAWARILTDAIKAVDPPSQLLATADARTPEVTGPDWPALPARIQSCLGRKRAHALLDWRTAAGDEGRRRHQEEYLEWRVVRDGDGRPRRIEMTTEFGDYWRVLAAHEPRAALERVAAFAGEETVDPHAVYGDLDPFGPGVDSARRRDAFAATMLPRPGQAVASPYNNGQRAICCMVEGSNTLGALINLVAASAEPRVLVDSVSGDIRPMSGSEVIQVIRTNAAQDCRNSDPVVVERVVALAIEGRLIALDQPVGVYIRGVEHAQLAAPDGSDIPADWFEFSRGLGPEEAADGRPRYQRLTFEVPDSAGFSLADVKQRATGNLISHGAQLAELVTLGVYLRTSAAHAITLSPEPVEVPVPIPCPEQPGCAEVRESWAAFERTSGELS
jgi:hypothetical protein